MSVLQDLEKQQGSQYSATYDVVVVGAGPYGLSITTHLRKQGLKVAIFGKTMNLWREHMPKGMHLRSRWWGTSLSDPDNKYGIRQFFKAFPHYDTAHPLPIETFIDYGMWFQKNAVPDVDETYISSIERQNGQFLFTLEDGRRVQSSSAILALGMYYFANLPAEYTQLSPELVSHSFDHSDFSCFAGKEVALVGAGQSAVEYAALLHQAGATVHLVSRRSIEWLGPDNLESRPLIEKLRSPAAAIAPGWKNKALEIFPYLFYRYPQERKDHFMSTRYGPAASNWLRALVLGKVILHDGNPVRSIKEVDHRVELTLADNEVLSVDHVKLATGYRVDISRLQMLSPSLLSEIQTDQDVPLLNEWFESNVPGLYFVGNTSVRTYGPLYRHVVGTKAAAQRVTKAITRKARRYSRVG